MSRIGSVLIAAALSAGACGVAAAAGDLTFGKSHVFLLWEDTGGFSDDMAEVDGPIAAVTKAGRSLQMVVDVIVEGEPNARFDPPAVLTVEARSTAAEAPVLFKKSWPIQTIGDFGTAMRTFVVDHACSGVTVSATVEGAGAVSDRWEKRFDIVCEEAL